MMKSNLEQQFAELCSTLERDHIIDQGTVTGCTDSEIQTLADRYQLELPLSYRLFLARMGRNAGRLTAYGEYDFDYDTVLRLTDDTRRFALEDGTRQHLDCVVGPTDLIVLTRQGDFQLVIRCDGSPDSKVWYYFSDDFRTEVVHPNIYAMIDSLADECRRIKYW
ncbi:SMI1/KNR4 family protein [Planctomycetes bacterium TBK1r]|uniref:Knr4/Smi1-like domain-containing protein n=1 Tax=Stieleria magnilauensis TaxID=2527963 RepID=A0ABX5Y2U6_9BACT|nr:hypothetical protein TBK1r_65510 [Planctomycetes bacterium TBK1r]